MSDHELITGLRQLKVQTGSIACLGCGYEQNCSIHGCRIMRLAADQLEQLTGPEGLVAVPATRGDTLRQMTDRELAEELFQFRFDGYAKAMNAEMVLPDTVAGIEGWLKEEMAE